MIGRSLELLKKQLENYLEGRNGWLIPGSGTRVVNVDNIGLLDLSNITTDKEGIIISLINLELENTLKNFGSSKKVAGVMEYRNSSVYTNLHILFSAVAGKDNYRRSLTWLSHTINFFQMKNIFTYSNSPDPMIWDSVSTDWDGLTLEQKMGYKLILDFHPLKLDQTNQLWSTLGSKQVPHVVFKARLVELRDEQILSTGSVISNLNSSEIIN